MRRDTLLATHKPEQKWRKANATKIYCRNHGSVSTAMMGPALFTFLALLATCSAQSTSSPCLTEFLCSTVGLFPQCPNACDVGYFRCSGGDINQLVTPSQCDFGLVFDLNFQHPYCVLPSDCPSTPSTGGSTSSTGCLTTFTCTTAGNFPACSTCDPQYFQCTNAGIAGVLTSCNNGLVFNTNSAYPYCVLPSNCPYNPIG
ncbi:uncharacterized protein LOC119593892 [Penaeus monodon]|uniref:uncharacterized protein LOC119593892 n=1 Tax=Penaeus monodon TaxID=6687 RepID=UPI0018A75025|nr:uncharacterized protein LOC119593892 [Penaeus monodon]